MVFFTCNVCNESLKKNQVAKHRLHKCRNSQFFSCVDCAHDFWGNDFEGHIKCMSEEQKYNGKHFVAKVNKGEVKQEQWIQKVQAAIQKAQANPQLKNLLIKLEEFPNVPRKKAKFENFLKCSLRVFNQALISEVWDLLMAEAQQQQQNGSSNGTAADKNKESEQEPSAQPDNQVEDSVDAEKKLSKRERKEERKKKAHKAEKKDKSEAAEEEVKSHKTGKRRKRDEEDEAEEEEEENRQPKNKKKKADISEEEPEPENGRLNDSELVVEKKGKFDWAATILAVLESKGEISVKKLRKKVLAEYETYGGSRGEERAEATFNKRLRKLPNVKVLKDKARLTSS